MTRLPHRSSATDGVRHTSAPRSRVWRPGRPVDVAGTWGTLRRGAGDPAWRQTGEDLWRGVLTPHGPATLRVRARPGEGVLLGHAWGPGAEWVLESLPAALGAGDDPDGFVPEHPVLAAAIRARPGWRVPRTGLVLEALLPAVVEQKVTGQEAFGGWRRLLHRHGDPAPGPGASLGLRVAPSVQTLGQLPSWQWLQLGIGPQRADTLMRVLRVAERMEETTTLSPSAARKRLCAVPGVGVWTAAETAQRALGDADAVSFGDYHVAANIGWALTGEPVDDQALVPLLAPYAGHRYRVQRLLELAGRRRPRRGPRMPARTHLPTRTW